MSFVLKFRRKNLACVKNTNNACLSSVDLYLTKDTKLCLIIRNGKYFEKSIFRVFLFLEGSVTHFQTL